MDFSIDMLNVGNADAFIFWIKGFDNDIVIFLDGGNTTDGKDIIDHYKSYILPQLSITPYIIVINSHPHKDHIGGLFDIINFFRSDIKRVYYNNPLDYIDIIKRNVINEYYQSYGKTSKKISEIYESLKDVDDFTSLLKKYNIPSFKAFSDTPLDHSLFKFLGPSELFYKQKVEFFTDQTNLKNISLLKENEEVINELDEGNIPCKIVDEVNDDNAENITSSLFQLTDSSNRRYLFTSDAGVDSFESAKECGFDMANFHIAQLPHHGSRRNVNTNWICNLNPSQYWVSANGDNKHPRRAVINCIKKNLEHCKTYSTHKGGTKHINSKAGLFTERNWGTAEPL